MKVTLFPCGPAANESELKAFAQLKNRLQSEPGEESWILLANLVFSVTHQLQSDEIDLVVIGPSGVRVIEIKHWTAQWFDAHKRQVESEAERLINKARKIGTTLRRTHPQLSYVAGAILLTQEPSKIKRVSGQEVRGVGIYTLNDWKELLGLDQRQVLSTLQVQQLAQAIQPQSAVAVDGSLRRLAGYVNLELQTPKDEPFHRVYKGSHPARRDRVVLHLYDLSASDEKNAEARAKREFETLHRLQLYSWAPRILDSFQPAPGYEGELFFFTIVDPAAPNVEDRATDATWKVQERLAFARNAVRALSELHAAGSADEPIVHRNLTLRTILVKHDNVPILTGFERTRIPDEISVASSTLPAGEYLSLVAPEVRIQGWAAADQRSDIYSLCACLSHLFQGRNDALSQNALQLLTGGLTEKLNLRTKLIDLETKLANLLGESIPPLMPPPARFWTEDQVIRFHERDYRILSRLGSGGVGTTFKVIETDRRTKEEFGTYVAKVVHDGESGQRFLKAYSLVRSHLRHTALSTIFEVAREWDENGFVALMTWISGAPLAEFMGVFPLLAEEQQEFSSEVLALRWIRDICKGLDVLHRNGLIHGDVSPRNLIVSGSDLVLTDYDFVGKIGERIAAPGTVVYCSSSYEDGRLASPSDDIYALAATFFHVIFEKEPFRYGGELDKQRGLNWEGISLDEYPTLKIFLDRATHHDQERRYPSVDAALTDLALREVNISVEEEQLKQPDSPIVGQIELQTPHVELREERVEWLLSLLHSFPGSRWGNRETRGLDTEFAAQTYVPTVLEESLLQAIRERKVRLVILCGNAGDGKTALLQHLAAQLGLGEHRSSERILEGQVPQGPLVRMNLDGSAAWRGRSADEILDEFLEPFQEGPSTEDIVHLLAINDGRLLEWIEGVEKRRYRRSTPLTVALYALLQQEATDHQSYIRFISLNQRSLVGGVRPDRSGIDTVFLDRLIDHLYGGEQAPLIWSNCLSCSAQERCEVFQAARLFGPDTLPSLAESPVRSRTRSRLFEVLQAVHLRGETHITMRELRATLVYILFGIHFCDDYHAESESAPLSYWDRTFLANAPARQGEVLAELARFDPALEAHPQIDRHLLSTPHVDSGKTAPHYPRLSLASARRRAFFEWTKEDIEGVTGDSDALDLARGRHLREFRELPLADGDRLAEICARLCQGISRLEDLPPQALDRSGVVPLRITPRTPTETAFWVEKPLSAFRLQVTLPPDTAGLERLHREVSLVYQYSNGRDQESLRLGAELFHLLLELADGYQLGDVSTDDTFAHLSIFVQRLVREDECKLLAWNPMQDETIYKISATITETASGPEQRMIISPLEQEFSYE